MKITFICANDCAPEGWSEDYETDTIGEPVEIIGKLLNSFNATLRPNEKPRRLIKIISSEASERKPLIIPHSWEKQNLVTIIDRHGIYDKMKCKICGITGKRHGVGPHVAHDPKFDKPKYQSCTRYDL